MKTIKIIAETAFSHEGDFNYLLKQIKAAKQANADFIKFQVFINKAEYITRLHPSYNMLDKWMFTEEQWLNAFEYAKKNKLKILVLPLNASSVKFCLKNDKLIELYEIHSICFNEIDVLKRLRDTKKKIVLGIGGRLPQEIDFAISTMQKKNSDIILMYGFQSFPTDMTMINLNKIKNFKQLFNCEIGYADHSSFENDNFYRLNNFAYLLGAEYFEKHIVIEKGEKRIDFESAISYTDFITMHEKHTEFNSILGNGDVFYLNSKEQDYKDRQKQIVVNRDIEKGEKISFNDLSYKIAVGNSDFEQNKIENIINRTASTKIKKDTPIKFEHIQ